MAHLGSRAADHRIDHDAVMRRTRQCDNHCARCLGYGGLQDCDAADADGGPEAGVVASNWPAGKLGTGGKLSKARPRRGGREAEGGGLLNRYTGENLYRGFESLPLRQPNQLGFI
jgi:hypothetical protein